MASSCIFKRSMETARGAKLMQSIEKTMRDGLALLIAASFSWGCSSSSSNGDDGPAYRLTNTFLGPDAALVAGAEAAEPPNVLGFGAAQDDARLQWVLTPLDSGYYRITNRALGGALSLDIINDADDGGSNDRLTMSDTAETTGQRWLITPLNNGFCRFTTDFLGPDISLDAVMDTGMPAQPVMRPSGDFSGQYWQLSAPGSAADPVLASCDGEPG